MKVPEYTIVTGVPRSGTSMQMQTLQALGIPLAGDEYPQLKSLKRLVKKEKIPDVPAEGFEAHPEGPIMDDDGNIVLFKIEGKYYEVDSHDVFKRQAHAKDMNPKGFYEISGAVMKGLQDLEISKNKAVKIIVAGIPERRFMRRKPVIDEKAEEFLSKIESEEEYNKLCEDIKAGKDSLESDLLREQVLEGRPFLKDEYGDVLTKEEEKIVGTSPEITKKAKIILCLRDPRNVAISQRKLQGNVEIATEEGFKDFNAVMPANPTRYAIEMGQFYLWLKKEDPKLDMLKVTYDDMHDNTSEQVDKIISFLGIDPTDEQKQEAIGNVTPGLRRSIDFQGWTEEVKEEGDIATKLYEYFVSGIEPEGLETEVEDFLKNKMAEGVRWVDTEFGLWCVSNPTFHRQLSENVHGLRDKMFRQYRNRNNQTHCEFYSRSVVTYEVPRPRDLGFLKRRLIYCKKKNQQTSLEYCFQCWHKGKLF